MTTRSFAFKEGASQKFWEVTLSGPQLTIRFGRVGSNGQTQLKKFSSPTAASATAEALIRSKLKKGYLEGAARQASAGKPQVKKSVSKAPKPEALFKAFEKRDLAGLTRLLDGGGDVNSRSPHGSTLLHLAADSRELPFVELLLERGANTEARDSQKRTAYALTGSPAIRAALRKGGAKGLDQINGRVLKPKSKSAKPAQAEIDGGALGVDAKGNLWFASYDGVQRWDGKTLTRFVFKESFSVERILAGARALTFFSTNWGIVTFDGKEWRLVGPEESELHDQHITDFAVDRNGVAYALGYGGEETVDRPISRYDGKSVTVLTAGADFPRGLETKTVAFDEQNQMVFVTNKGVLFADGKKWAPGDREVARVVFDGNTTWADCGYFGLFRRIGAATKKFKFDDGIEALQLSGKTMFVGNSGGLHRVEGDDVQQVPGFEDGVDGLALGKNGTLWVSSGGKVFSVEGDVTRSLDGQVIDASK